MYIYCTCNSIRPKCVSNLPPWSKDSFVGEFVPCRVTRALNGVCTLEKKYITCIEFCVFLLSCLDGVRSIYNFAVNKLDGDLSRIAWLSLRINRRSLITWSAVYSNE